MTPEEELAMSRAIQTAAGIVVSAALDLLQADPHMWSTRQCGTCKAISALVGRDFGCIFYAKMGKRS